MRKTVIVGKLANAQDIKEIAALAKVPVVENQETVIHSVCAWCQKPLGEKDGKGQSGTSHGICGECLAKMIPKGHVICEKCGADEQVWQEIFNESHQPCTAPTREELGKNSGRCAND